jgi:hypothetical protein
LPSQRPSAFRQARIVAVFFGVALAIFGARLLASSQAALQAGLEARARGDAETAAAQFGRAIRHHVPASPFVARAIAALRGMANEAAARGDYADERRALEALRTGLLAIRSLYLPFASEVAAADARLAALYAAEATGHPPGAPSARQREALLAAQLAQRPGAGACASALFLGGFALFVGGAWGFARRAVSRTLVLRSRAAVGCAAAFVVGFGLFLVGAYL